MSMSSVGDAYEARSDHDWRVQRSRRVRGALSLLCGGSCDGLRGDEPVYLCPEAGREHPDESVRRERHDLRPVDVGRVDQCGTQRRAAGG